MVENKFFTTHHTFEIPILRILEKIGGEAFPYEVYAELEKVMKLTDADRTRNRTGSLKWQNNAQWARNALCDKGEVDRSKRGKWRITDKGRQRLAREGSSYDQSNYNLGTIRSPALPMQIHKESGMKRLIPPEKVSVEFLQKWGIKQELNLFELGLEGVRQKYEEFYQENAKKTKGKYYSLRESLRKIPPNVEQINVEFKEIEELIGDELAKSARTYPAYWANSNSPNQLVKAILDEGWEIEDVFLKNDLVVLRRKDTDPISYMPKYLHYILEGSPQMPKANPSALARWIRTCRQIGLYFQGKILYEKGGLTPESLSDQEAAKVEEDYRVCLRKSHRSLK